MELGVKKDELDPAWMEGVKRVRAGYANARHQDIKSAGS